MKVNTYAAKLAFSERAPLPSLCPPFERGGKRSENVPLLPLIIDVAVAAISPIRSLSSSVRWKETFAPLGIEFRAASLSF